MTWASYDGTRDIKFLKCGAIALRPKEKADVVPAFCPLCKLTMKSSSDYLAFKQYECCEKCELAFARVNHEKWKQGWRPDKNSESYKLYMERRVNSKPNITFA
jgi:hypothetical protein